MTKLKIDVDALRVDSFATTTPVREKGTVVAHALAPSYPDPVYTCAYHCTWIGVTCER